MTSWYIFDAGEILAGPFISEKQAHDNLNFYASELYLLDDYPNACVEALDEDYFNIEDWEYSKYKEMWEYDLEQMDNLPKYENIRRYVK